jgi:PAS domain S-box-containing protein
LATVRVLIAEDEESSRLALCDLVGREEAMELVGCAASADEAIELAKTTTPHVVLVDVRMPGGGASLVRRVKECSPTTRALAFSADSDQATVIQVLSAGAVGYVVKGTSPTEILEAVNRAARGQASLSIEAISKMIEELVGDIAEREHAQGLLAAIVESSDDAIIGKDLEGTIETWNLGAERMYGYSAEEVVGRSIALLVPPYMPDDLPGILDRLRRGEEVEQYATNRMRKDEVVLDVVLKIAAIRDAEGQLVGTSSIARDVTRLKAQDELEREHALLAHLVHAGEEERGRIAAGIHDDSIQAITAAGMRLQILRRSLDDPKQLQLLEELEKTIQLSIGRLRHLLFELRPPELDTTGLAAALELYLSETQNEGPTHHVLEDRLSARPPAEACTILYRIAQEVLANVRKHAEAANAKVVLEDRDEGYAIRVSDDGIGFDPGDLKPVPGHLGLAAMQERAALAGGWLRIHSAPGEGATVEVWIPKRPVSPLAHEVK